MNIVLVPQGSAVNLVLVPQEGFVEMIAFADLLDAHLLLSATEHLKLALRHYPRRAAMLEIIAPEYRVHAPEFAAALSGILDGIPRFTQFALVFSDEALAYFQAAHNYGAFLRLMASRRAAMEWFEQTGILPRPPESTRTKKFSDWLCRTHKRDLLTAGRPQS